MTWAVVLFRWHDGTLEINIVVFIMLLTIFFLWAVDRLVTSQARAERRVAAGSNSR